MPPVTVDVIVGIQEVAAGVDVETGLRHNPGRRRRIPNPYTPLSCSFVLTAPALDAPLPASSFTVAHRVSRSASNRQAPIRTHVPKHRLKPAPDHAPALEDRLTAKETAFPAVFIGRSSPLPRRSGRSPPPIPGSVTVRAATAKQGPLQGKRAHFHSLRPPQFRHPRERYRSGNLRLHAGNYQPRPAERESAA